MILGFLGKGGSGKSSLATQMTLFLHKQGHTVLAIDADHNMDLSYNLNHGETPAVRYLSESMADILNYTGLSADAKYSDVFLKSTDTKKFTLNPTDWVTSTYSTTLANGILLMVAGPQTDTVLYGKSCSHSLTTPLKVYLPLLDLKTGEIVVVDEKAGADGVTTGIVTGMDVGIIVCEPALHSLKTARQIADLMDFYATPYLFVGNKINTPDDKDFITKTLGEKAYTSISQNSNVGRNVSEPIVDWQDALSEILINAYNLNKNNRLKRTCDKFMRNHEFAKV